MIIRILPIIVGAILIFSCSRSTKSIGIIWTYASLQYTEPFLKVPGDTGKFESNIYLRVGIKIINNSSHEARLSLNYDAESSFSLLEGYLVLPSKNKHKLFNRSFEGHALLFAENHVLAPGDSVTIELMTEELFKAFTNKSGIDSLIESNFQNVFSEYYLINQNRDTIKIDVEKAKTFIFFSEAIPVKDNK
jgi:hypothetical protein